MSRAPDQLAPSWLPRQQRRRIDRAVRKLIRRDVCSVCGSRFEHNTRTAPGLDAQGNPAVAGECCIGRLTEIFAIGFYSTRHYDFLRPHDCKPNLKLTTEQIADALAAYQKVIANTDELLADVERRGGGIRASQISLLDHAWKRDDRDWFERNPSRSHRARAPFPGEVEAAESPAGCVPIMLVRQVEPGSRLRAACDFSTDLLPLPDDEAVIHALFDAVMQHETVPLDSAALRTLIEKYRASGVAS